VLLISGPAMEWLDSSAINKSLFSACCCKASNYFAQMIFPLIYGVVMNGDLKIWAKFG